MSCGQIVVNTRKINFQTFKHLNTLQSHGNNGKEAREIATSLSASKE